MRFPLALGLLVLSLVGAGLLAACRTQQPVEPVATPAAATPVPTLVTTRAAGTPAAVDQGDSAETGPVFLRVWLPPSIIAADPDRATDPLIAQINQFNQVHTDTQIVITAKEAEGPGGALDYLRTGQDVAPAILPDLIILPSGAVAAAAEGGLIHSWHNFDPAVDGDLLDDDMVNDLFPAAAATVRVDNQLYGYPLAVSHMLHMVYDSKVVTATIPTTWDAMLTVPNLALVLPAAGPGGAELALQLYLGAVSSLVDEDGDLAFQLGPLTKVLTRLDAARSAGRIATRAPNIATYTAAWAQLMEREATAAVVNAPTFYDDVAASTSLLPGPLPGAEGVQTPVVRTYAWALTTDDPVRQAISAELVSWLASPDNAGTWALTRTLLPAQRSAFSAWPENNYTAFLQAELERAQPYPALINEGVRTALSSAVFNVLTLVDPPLTAAQNVVKATQQP